MLLSNLLVGCGGPPPTADTSGWATWRRVDNAYAERFQIWERGADRLLLVFGHGGIQDTVGRYVVTTDDPSPLPVSALQLTPGLKEVATGSTTHVPYIAALGALEAIAACAHTDQVRDTVFASRVRQGLVREIALGDGLDREVLIAMRPRIFFGDPFGRGDAGALEQAGIPVVEVSEYLEEHPLGRAEWLRFFGVLLGRERLADSLFSGIRQRYEAIRADSTTRDRPSVLFGSVWSGQWWVPPGNSYMARFIEDAGGRYVFADRTGHGNIAVDMETMITVGAQAERWGMIAQLRYPVVLSDFTGGDPRLEAFRSVEQNGLFIGNSSQADLFGQALVEPDRELLDLIIALHPDGDYFQRDLPVVPAGYFRHVEWPVIPTVSFGNAEAQ